MPCNRVLSDDASFEARNFGCKAENVIARHRTMDATDFESGAHQTASLSGKRIMTGW